MRQKLWLILLAIFIESCASGPTITYCTLNGLVALDGQCSNGKVMTAAQMLNWVCLSPNDIKVELAACRHNNAAVTFCILGPAQMDCSDGTNTIYLPFTSAANYACVSPGDEENLLSYCKAN